MVPLYIISIAKFFDTDGFPHNILFKRKSHIFDVVVREQAITFPGLYSMAIQISIYCAHRQKQCKLTSSFVYLINLETIQVLNWGKAELV